ncbi:amidohydrolase [Alteromonas macleodii]|uniref:amidohydrolase n=1 Tax=Alteromonas macleodii TaxID=28108 RepID=UPI000580A491|nr:amidohydrolase [Alteromonas macleodii]KHT51408.1 amidohydrolase [Alteromonas macleodii]
MFANESLIFRTICITTGRLFGLFIFFLASLAAQSFKSHALTAEPIEADKIFLNGTIITVDDSQPIVGAVAVYQGKILSVGSESAVNKHRGDETDIIDLKGNTLLPGFIDIHTHPILSAMMAETADISGFSHKNEAEVIASIKAAVASKDKGEWVVAFGWDPAILRGLNKPTLAQLDDWAPNNPLFIISQTLHSAFANSLALKKAGVTKDTPDPDGGYFEKDANGELTGLIIEVNAMARFTNATPKFPISAYVYLLTKQFEEYAKAGYTTIVAPGLQTLFPDAIESFREVAEHETSPVRTFIYPTLKDFDESVFSRIQGNSQFKVMGPKLWIDGSPYAGGMAMSTPYLTNDFVQNTLGINAGSRGHLNFSDQELNTLVTKFHKQGWQIAAHIQGERAAKQFLDTVDAAQKAFPRNDARHRMEHVALVTDEQFERAKGLGVTPSFYMDHIYYYGDALTEVIVGPERAQRYMAINSAKAAGHHVTIHTDTPSSPLGVLRAMHIAVTRTSRSGKYQLGPQEAISKEDAIKAVTIDAAWQIFEQDTRGSIEVGKLADFTVVSENLLDIEAAAWPKVQIVDTYIGGERVQQRSWSWRKISLMTQAVWGMLFD